MRLKKSKGAIRHVQKRQQSRCSYENMKEKQNIVRKWVRKGYSKGERGRREVAS